MDNLISSLPQNNTTDIHRFEVVGQYLSKEGNVCTVMQVAAVKAKGWFPCYYDSTTGEYVEYKGSDKASTTKGDVNGDDANPLFVELATAKPFQGFDGLKAVVMNKVAKSVDKEFGDKAYIKWNFTKFLVGRDGTIIERFEPTAKMDKVEKAIVAQL